MLIFLSIIKFIIVMCLNSIKKLNVLHLSSTTHSINYDFRFEFFIINKLMGISNPFSSPKKKKTLYNTQTCLH